ncbi:MAG: hypothetical protein SVM86_05930 [Candidatus Cloacimonadota bacterium]|nr:hypothetical protein [Candidatus Cloacimonadota bacterium]
MKYNSKILIFFILFFFSSTLAAQFSKINVLKSAVIPGWGEISMGNHTGYAFIASEILFWSAHLYFSKESDLKVESAHNYAYRYAGVNPKNDYQEQYWTDLKNYDSYGFESGGYNAQILQQAQNIEDPDKRQQFIDENIYMETHFWKWESDAHQHDYKILQKRSLEYSDYAKIFSGAIVANHIISIINSLRISAQKPKLNMKVRINNDMNPLFTVGYNF